MRDDEINRVFLRDFGVTPPPRIYARYTMAERQGIELEELPIVNYVDLQNGGRRP